MTNDIAMDNQAVILGRYTESQGKWWVECQDDETFSVNDFTNWLEEVELPTEEEIKKKFPEAAYAPSFKRRAYDRQEGAKWLLELIKGK